MARAVDLSRSQVSRVERAIAPGATVLALVRMGAVVGLDIRVRSYPGGDPLRDAAQIRLLDRFRRRLPSDVTFKTEVPLPIVGDLRAWDGWIDGLLDRSGSPTGLAVEAETRISDAQALTRRLGLKLRDAGIDHVVVVVADTRSNRTAVASAGAALSGMFPVSARLDLARTERRPASGWLRADPALTVTSGGRRCSQ